MPLLRTILPPKLRPNLQPSPLNLTIKIYLFLYMHADLLLLIHHSSHPIRLTKFRCPDSFHVVWCWPVDRTWPWFAECHMRTCFLVSSLLANRLPNPFFTPLATLHCTKLEPFTPPHGWRGTHCTPLPPFPSKQAYKGNHGNPLSLPQRIISSLSPRVSAAGPNNQRHFQWAIYYTICAPRWCLCWVLCHPISIYLISRTVV